MQVSRCSVLLETSLFQKKHSENVLFTGSLRGSTRYCPYHILFSFRGSEGIQKHRAYSQQPIHPGNKLFFLLKLFVKAMFAGKNIVEIKDYQVLWYSTVKGEDATGGGVPAGAPPAPPIVVCYPFTSEIHLEYYSASRSSQLSFPLKSRRSIRVQRWLKLRRRLLKLLRVLR